VLYTYYGSESDACMIMEEHTNVMSAAGFSIK